MKLIDQIKHYNEAYRTGNPIISDTEYDKLVEQLKSEDPNNEWFKHVEPSPVAKSRKVKLPIPMKSLDKVKSKNDLMKWVMNLANGQSSVELVIMPKFDGLSLLHDEYSNAAFSRGGAENEGQDCTKHYICSGAAPCSDAFNYTFGEFVFKRVKWREFKEATKNYTDCSFKSPRNTAAGLLNRDIPDEELLKYVSFYRYGVDEGTLSNYSKFSDVLNDLCCEYHQEKMYEIVSSENGLDEEYLKEKFNTWNLIYPIDGIVVYINDLNVWKNVGRHQTTGNPQYAIAYKHPDFTDTFETTVTGITWHVSKSGALKPVVNIEPVDTGECSMENPTGYNAGWLYERKIAQGAKILVTRSGGVIPKILEVLEPANEEVFSKYWEDMHTCPVCGSLTEWSSNNVELNCTNRFCKGKVISKICHFYNICNAENMGEETITKLFNAGYDSIPAILNIKFEEIVQIDTFGDETANVILENNKRIKEGLDMATIMHASDCFTGIGAVKAKEILDSMDTETRSSFYHMEHNEVAEWAANMKKKSVTLRNFINGLAKFYHFLSSTRLTVLQYTPPYISEGTLTGMSICMTGFRNKDMENAIVQQGGKITGSVSKKTSLLIVKDKSITSAKMEKAISLKIPVITDVEFENLYLSNLQRIE